MAVELSAFRASFSQMREEARRLGWGDMELKGNAGLAVGSVVMFNAQVVPMADTLRADLEQIIDKQMPPAEADVRVEFKNTGPEIMGWYVVRLSYYGAWDLDIANDFRAALLKNAVRPKPEVA